MKIVLWDMEEHKYIHLDAKEIMFTFKAIHISGVMYPVERYEIINVEEVGK